MIKINQELFRTKHATSKHLGHGEWRVSFPLSPLRVESAEQERQEMLRSLLSEYSFAALWVSDWCDNNGTHWEQPSTSTLAARIAELHEGGWILLLSDQSMSLQQITTFPKESSEMRNLLSARGAMVGVFSWLDDIDWTVIFAGSGPEMNS